MRVIFSQSLCTAENANSTDSVSKYVSCCYFCFLLPKFITVGQCSLMNRGGLTWLSPPFACMTLSGPVSSGTVLSYGVGCICHVNAFSSCSIDKRCHLLIPSFVRPGPQHLSSLLPNSSSSPLFSHLDFFFYVAHMDDIYIVYNHD